MQAQTDMSSYYLELLENPLRFPPVTEDNNIFFDEGNKEVFSVLKEGEFTSVQVKGTDGPKSFNADFKVADKGHVISVKFSPDHSILAIQRSLKSVDFVTFSKGPEGNEYSQSCKGRSTQIMGFCWTNVNEIVFVTNQGISFYQLQPEKRSSKLLKSYSVNVNWFVYLSENSVLLLSSGIMGNVIHPYVFRSGSVNRLPKFEIDNPPSTRTPQPGVLLVRDVTVANIYGQIYVVVLRNQPRALNSIGAEVVLYQVQKDLPAKKTSVLRLGAVGRFAVNVVDNLIVVHHQASRTSMIFDINLNGECDGQINYYYPVLAPLPIQPCVVSSELSNATNTKGKQTVCDLYSPNWIVFQPNIIIDAKLGCLWQLRVKLESVVNMIEDKGTLIDFLSFRDDSKSVALNVCNQILCPGRQANLSIIAQIFDKLNSMYHSYIEACTEKPSAQTLDNFSDMDAFQTWFRGQSIIDQSDMYRNVFSLFTDSDFVDKKFMIAVLIEYVRSLNRYQIPVEYYLHELIINLLVSNKKFYQLHQFLQYHVLNDSKFLACLLLSLEKEYPPAAQLALDMMKRLPTASEEIVEILLSKHEVIAALRYLQSIDAVDSASPRKFLEAALSTGENMTFFTVYRFFQQRNIRLRKQPGFAPGEQCELYEKHFRKLFGKDRYYNEVDGLVEIVEGWDY